MTSEPPQDPARSFGSVADSYERGRPVYPDDAATWLIAQPARTVLELGAGTGKLTQRLVELGHDVHATEPDPQMLEVLRTQVPGARSTGGTAEEIPLPDDSVDVVVAAQAFHWFDHSRALPEIARVLRPGGHLALVWNFRDDRIPWVRRLGAIIGTPEQEFEPVALLEASALFGPVEEATFSFWQDVDRESLLDLVRSRSAIATMDEATRADTLAQVTALYDDYGRGRDGMQLPYLVHCFRAPVVDGGSPMEAIDGPDDATLLIDFR